MRRETSIEKLNKMYLVPIFSFCGLYLDDYGHICNPNYGNEPYRSALDNKKFIVISNYEHYEYFIRNKDELVPFDPYQNDRHLFLLMKFVQNSIFQIDSEFHEFFFENVYLKTAKTYERIEREISDEELTQEASKHIKLISLNADYRNCIRRKWIIESNLKNELIDKTIAEVYLPDSVPMNIAVLISLKEVVNFYNVYGENKIAFNDALTEAMSIMDLLDRNKNERIRNKKKFNEKIVQEKMNKEFDLFVDKKDELGSVMMPPDNRSFDIN